jgi:hypothetical protein
MQLSQTKNVTSPKNIPLDMDKWQDLVEAWDATKENQKAYCQRLGININTFSYVRHKLTKKQKSPLQFIPVTVSQPEPIKRVNREMLILENPCGYKLHISPALSLDQLTKILNSAGW